MTPSSTTSSAAPARDATSAAPAAIASISVKSKTFVARGEGVDRQPLVPALHFFDRQFAGDDDARLQARGLDPLLQIVGERASAPTATAPTITAVKSG